MPGSVFPLLSRVPRQTQDHVVPDRRPEHTGFVGHYESVREFAMVHAPLVSYPIAVPMARTHPS